MCAGAVVPPLFARVFPHGAAFVPGDAPRSDTGRDSDSVDPYADVLTPSARRNTAVFPPLGGPHGDMPPKVDASGAPIKVRAFLQ